MFIKLLFTEWKKHHYYFVKWLILYASNIGILSNWAIYNAKQSEAMWCDVMRCVVCKFMAKHLFVKDNQPSDQKMCVNVPTYQRTCGRKTNITKRKRIPLDEMQSNSAPCSCDLCQTNSEWKTMETKNCAFSTL